MIRLNCDYLEGCHPLILEKLAKANLEQNPGYGCDPHCSRAADLIREAFSCPGADVHFMVGGTQTNKTVIAAALRPYEGVICAHTGHINVHETGAVEATGHKVLAVPGVDGKLTADQILAEVARQHDDEHMVKPAMVYISMSTELGTVYTLKELEAIAAVCREKKLYLFIDGARLGYALKAENGDVTPADIARCCDVFYVGGTKVGALMGEAVVILNDALKPNYRYMMKREGGMLAKGWLLGIQFETLFENGLYFTIAEKAVSLALRIKAALKQCGIPLFADTPTNQVFAVFTNEQLAKLSENFALEVWEPVDDDHTAARVCTSWATTDEQADALISALKSL